MLDKLDAFLSLTDGTVVKRQKSKLTFNNNYSTTTATATKPHLEDIETHPYFKSSSLETGGMMDKGPCHLTQSNSAVEVKLARLLKAETMRCDSIYHSIDLLSL